MIPSALPPWNPVFHQQSVQRLGGWNVEFTSRDIALRGPKVNATRRGFLHYFGLALLAPGAGIAAGIAFSPSSSARAKQPTKQPTWRHGVSAFGDLKYPSGFARFDYVNPDAVPGGTLRQGALGTFDNFNVVVAGLKGSIPAGIDLIYETLLLPSLDEASSAYGLLAEAVANPDDVSFVRYRLRDEARWHGGRAVTAEDVLFSFEAFKKHNPQLSSYFRHVVKSEITGDREITFTFDSPGNRELPQILGELKVLPRHWWETNDRVEARRDVAATTLEPPLGSGPYRIKSFEPGRTIVYERVRDYWGKTLNVRCGCNNFDELRFDYFRDLAVAFEAFKAGDLDWHVENSSKSWVVSYDFPAVSEGRVVREEFPIRNVGIMQAFAFNIRRAKFADARVRRAFNFAFDFEAINGEIFYGQYQRISSYFQGTELALLEKLRDQVPPEVFTTAFWNPVAGSPRASRKNLLHAMTLMNDAGFTVRDMQLVDPATGGSLEVEFLLAQRGFEPCTLIYKAALERLGITVKVRLVDPVQYENRVRQRDFDIIIDFWTETLSPGNEQRGYWGSHAADTPGSRNTIGIKNPAVDALIDRLVWARDRAELIAATKALDRVLLWNHYVVPQWSYDKLRTARWDKFGRPELMPKYGISAFPTIWWWDARRMAKTG
jgi:microcin C transport system substrate-binding protein